MSTIRVEAIQTKIFAVGESLVDFVVESVPAKVVSEKMVLAVTSKIVSLAERRLVPIKEVEKRTLVQREADVFLGEIGHGCFLTIKEGLLIPSAGIDESNSASGDYILYPTDPYASAQQLWRDLRQRWQIRELGIILTDSHTTPLRRGVIGVSLAHWGFEPLRHMVGKLDLFGRELKMTNMNLVDGMAVSAVYTMGEGAESQPLAVISSDELIFTERDTRGDLVIAPQEDLYAPFFKGFLT